MSGWTVQAGSTAPVSLTKQGVTVTVTKPDQVTEVVSDGYMLRPNSFVQALVYLPPENGVIANFPALWAVSLKPSEFDMVEGLAGQACSHTHYLNADTSTGLCAPSGKFTGWHTYSALWANGKITFWYDSTREGSLPMPVPVHQRLLFQNRSTGPYCPSCYGPSLYPSGDILRWVRVWSLPN
jgi:hypothetical protein